MISDSRSCFWLRAKKMSFVRGKVVLLVTSFILLCCLLLLLLHSPVHTQLDILESSLWPPAFREKLHYNVTAQPLLFSKPGLGLYIYRAFRDGRPASGDIIRIFGMDKYNDHPIVSDFVCKWRNQDGNRDDDMQEVPSRKYYIDNSWPRWSPYFAFGIDCNLPKSVKPRMIHLVSEANGCDFELAIEESITTLPRGDLAVCVKPAMGKLDVNRLVEWFELHRMTGIHHFIIYNSDVRGPGRLVLQYYLDRGMVTLVEFPFLQAVGRKVESPELSSQQRFALYQQAYLVAYQDCLYRFYKSYKLIEFIDFDEVMLPSSAEPWPEALKRLTAMKPAAAGFKFLKTWHFEESTTAMESGQSSVPEYLYMQKFSAATDPINNQPRSVVVTAKAATVSFHGVITALEEGATDQFVPWKDFGSVHHFVGKCSDNFEEHHCRKLTSDNRHDSTVTRYTKGLQERVREILQFLQLSHL